MKRYLSKVRHCVKSFTLAKFQQILREEYMEADSLAKAPSVDGIINEQVKVQYIPSIDVPEEANQIDEEANQTTSIISYLNDGILPEEKEEAQRPKVRATKFVLMDEVLYKRGFPLLGMFDPRRLKLHYEGCP